MSNFGNFNFWVVILTGIFVVIALLDNFLCYRRIFRLKLIADDGVTHRIIFKSHKNFWNQTSLVVEDWVWRNAYMCFARISKEGLEKFYQSIEEITKSESGKTIHLRQESGFTLPQSVEINKVDDDNRIGVYLVFDPHKYEGMLLLDIHTLKKLDDIIQKCFDLDRGSLKKSY